MCVSEVPDRVLIPETSAARALCIGGGRVGCELHAGGVPIFAAAVLWWRDVEAEWVGGLVGAVSRWPGRRR